MRNCPHCNNEIQDEAVFCRFCRKDVDPPLWMTSLVKCPYCAEWVERGIDRCPLCGKAVSSEAPFSVEIETENQSEAEDFLDRLRRSGLPDEEVDEEETGDDGLFEKDQEPESKPLTEPETELEQLDYERTSIGRDSEPIDEGREIERTPSQPTDEGIAVLHSRRLDYASDFERREEQKTELEEEDKPSALQNFLEGPWLRWIGSAAAVVAVVVLGILLFPRIREALETLPTPAVLAGGAETDTPTPTTTTATETVEVTPGTGVLLPTPRPTDRNCYSWDEITLEMAGQSVCAFGDLRRWFQVDEIPYVVIFSEEPGTFAIIDRAVTYPEYTPGTCVTTTGEVEIMRGTRPFIEVDGDLETCE